MKTPWQDWKADIPARAWSPKMDFIYGNPFDLCACTHERQSHDMLATSMSIRRNCLIPGCGCHQFRQAPEYCI